MEDLPHAWSRFGFGTIVSLMLASYDAALTIGRRSNIGGHLKSMKSLSFSRCVIRCGCKLLNSLHNQSNIIYLAKPQSIDSIPASQVSDRDPISCSSLTSLFFHNLTNLHILTPAGTPVETGSGLALRTRNHWAVILSLIHI